MAPPHSVLVTHKRGLLKGKASVSKQRAFWPPCCNYWAFAGMIDLCEATRKECEISGFQLPARGWHPTWHSFFCLHSEMGRESGSSPRYLTRLTWDCSHPGVTGRHGREGMKPPWTRTSEDRLSIPQNGERVQGVAMFSKLENQFREYSNAIPYARCCP